MNHIVIGAGFGDEGKGMFVDYLCSQHKNSIVIRFSGGQQAGHHVVTHEKSHVFSNFGSGTLKEVPTFWNKHCTIDPEGILNELKILQEIGIDPVLYIDPKCPVTTPFDKSHNQTFQYTKNGTVGVGVGATLEREEKYYSLLAEDLFFNSALKMKTELIQHYYSEKGLKGDIDLFFRCCNKLLSIENIKIRKPDLKKYDNHIYEGSQGLLLDQNIGFFPHVTRGNTGTKNLRKLSNDSNVHYVTRAYQTRHGRGPMTNEHIPHNIKENPYEQNGDHQYQGKFRKALLDLDLLRYGIKKDNAKFNKHLVITCLDLIQDEFRFTDKQEVVNCDNENNFTLEIAKRLKIYNVFLSKSPISTKIISYKNN